MSIQLLRRPVPLLLRFRCGVQVNRTEERYASTDRQAGKPSDDPVKFSQSDAFLKWKASHYYEEPNPSPPIEPWVRKGSMAIFFLYFCFLREENDIDEMLMQPVWKTVPELEIPLFEAAVIQHRQANLPTADLEAHLKQALIRKEKEKAASKATN